MISNRLENFISNNRLDPVASMNRLQAAGIVSDNCVTAADVATADVARAVKFLLDNQRDFSENRPA